MGSLDPDRPEVEAQKRLHEEHADALNRRCQGNRAKAIEGEDCNPGITKIDVSLGSDGLGSFGLRWISHRPFFGMSGMTRDNLLGIHTELTMVHNYGVFGHISFPGIETCGADMTLNAVYRSVFLSMEGRPYVNQIRNLYGGLDNTASSNKAWTIMFGMATLVALGVVEKAVLTFRLVGHTKNEIDQAGGIVSTKISKKMMLTLDAWKRQVEIAMKSEKGRCFDMKSTEFCFHGCPDYTHEFSADYADTKKINGISRVQEVRFAMHPTEDYVEMHYKSHYLSKGWLPRFEVCLCNDYVPNCFFCCRAVIPAAEGFTCEHWQKVPEFQHPNPSQGIPINVESVPMTGPGQKLFWLYKVSSDLFCSLVSSNLFRTLFS